MTVGYEFVGVIELGAGVDGFDIGQRVSPAKVISSAALSHRAGREHYSRTLRVLGLIARALADYLVIRRTTSIRSPIASRMNLPRCSILRQRGAYRVEIRSIW